MKLKQLSKSLALVALVAVSSASCVGSFSLSHKLLNWNRSFKNQWGQEGIFLAFVILPVYGISLLGDAIIFNSIEFWSGDNPMAGKEPIQLKDGNESARLSIDKDCKTMRITKLIDGKVDREMTVTRLDANTLQVAADGTVQTAKLVGDLIQVEKNGQRQIVQIDKATDQVAMFVR